MYSTVNKVKTVRMYCTNYYVFHKPWFGYSLTMSIPWAIKDNSTIGFVKYSKSPIADNNGGYYSIHMFTMPTLLLMSQFSTNHNNIINSMQCKQSSINDPPDVPTVTSEYSEVNKTVSSESNLYVYHALCIKSYLHSQVCPIVRIHTLSCSFCH